MLTLVGLGLCDGLDITIRGKHAVDEAQHVYIESYTSLLQCSHEELEEQLGCTIRRLDRTMVEVDIDKVLKQALQEKVVILVIGDVFGATTHADLFLRAKELGVEVQVVHNASILNAVGTVGLELYRFGKTVSIPYWLPGFEPTSFLDGVKENYDRGLHTLCLLDIKADEQRFMSVEEGLNLLMEAEGKKKYEIVHEGTLAVGCARVGSSNQKIVAAPVAFLKNLDFGTPPHCLIIPGKLHHIEEQMLEQWK
jgi:diphthine methyl ester synthase